MEPIIKIVQAIFAAVNTSTYGVSDNRAAFLKDFFGPGQKLNLVGISRL